MKILITTPIFPPEIRGPAIYTYQLCQQLKAKNQECVIVTFTQDPQPIPAVTVVSLSQGGNSFTRQWRLFREILILGKNSEIIYAQGADVVGLASVLAGKLLSKKVIIKFVGDLSDELKRDFGHDNYLVRLATWVSLRLADKIIYPAKHLQKSMNKRYSIPADKTVVIYNAVDV
ncbi:glycosyltransferase family 4 protein [Candidatus Microgenomates bacterium]|nr:glycosyltransferase family 4 protein [Candidatus Microgenomates bacterium]